MAPADGKQDVPSGKMDFTSPPAKRIRVSSSRGWALRMTLPLPPHPPSLQYHRPHPRCLFLVRPAQISARWPDTKGRTNPVKTRQVTGRESQQESVQVDRLSATAHILTSLLSSSFSMRPWCKAHYSSYTTLTRREVKEAGFPSPLTSNSFFAASAYELSPLF